MKIKIQKSHIFMICIFFAILVECDFFCNFKINLISDYYKRNYIIAILCVAMFFMCLCDRSIYGSMKIEYKRVNGIVILTFIATAICATYYIIIDKMANNVIINILPFFSVLMIYPLIYIFKDWHREKWFIFGLTLIVSVTLIMRIKMVYDYYFNGTIPNEIILIPNGGLKLRYGILKIYPTSLGALTIILTFCLALFYKKMSRMVKTVLLSISVMGYLYFVLLYQSRMWTIFLFFIMILVYLRRNNRIDKKIFSFAVVIILIIYLSFSGVFTSLFESFGKSSEYWHSTQLRINGIRYLLGNIITHPFGNGFNTEFTVSGTIYYPDDYGFLESFYRFGWIAAILYSFYIKLLYHNYRNSDYKSKVVTYGLLLYFAFGSFIFDTFIMRRIFAVPFVVAFSCSFVSGDMGNIRNKPCANKTIKNSLQ